MRVAHLAVGLDSPQRPKVGASRTYHELAHPVFPISCAIGCLEGEPFVVVVVTAEDHIGVVVIEHSPEGGGAGVTAVLTGAKPGVVPVSQGARCSVASEVIPEPLKLGGTPTASPTFSQLLLRTTMCQPPRL